MQHRIEDLLEETRTAAVSGDLVALTRLAPLVAMAAETGPDPDATSATIRAKARHAAALLAASARGIRSAIDRLDDIAAGPGLTTYDAKGRKAEVPPVPRRAPRRV